ncbi:MAG TPA: glycosyl transferase [Planctomycetaceae bacterium]|nr:glycosyl transferase [Planctomycetaceae bacterium]
MSQRERMTVLQLIPAMDSGGAEVCVLEQSRALVGAGHRVLVGSAGGRLESQLQAAGAEAVRLHCGMKSLHWFRSILQLRRLLLSEQVDLVDVHSRLPAWCLWFVLRLLPARQRPLVVHTVHGLNSLGYYSRIMLRASCVVAVSECVREHLRVMAGGQQTAGVVVIYRGVDSQRFSRRWPQSDGWRAEYLREHPEAIGRFLLLLPGRLSRGKGHVDLIRLLADLRAVGVEVQALCPGNTSGREHYVSELQSLAAALRVSDCLVFPGLREDLESIYAGVDVVLSLSSSPESFSLTTAEALATGVPVVGYDHGGAGELLRRIFSGGLVRPGDRGELFERVRRVLGGQLVPGPFPADLELSEMQRKTLELYEKIVSDRCRPGESC